jgi:hypothetical protein
MRRKVIARCLFVCGIASAAACAWDEQTAAASKPKLDVQLVHVQKDLDVAKLEAHSSIPQTA